MRKRNAVIGATERREWERERERETVVESEYFSPSVGYLTLLLFQSFAKAV